MSDYFIPLMVHGDLQYRADAFVTDIVPTAPWRIIVDARGKFIYVRRLMKDGSNQNLGRLVYNGDTENMPFAIFRNRTGKYDSKGDFSGAQYLDGTLEGAIRAILESYP